MTPSLQKYSLTLYEYMWVFTYFLGINALKLLCLAQKSLCLLRVREAQRDSGRLRETKKDSERVKKRQRDSETLRDI